MSSNMDPNPSGDILWYYISEAEYQQLKGLGWSQENPDVEPYNPVDDGDFYAHSPQFPNMIFAPASSIDPQEEAFLNMNYTLNSQAFRRSNQPVAILQP